MKTLLARRNWLCFLAALLCGIMACLTLPPFHFYPLLIPAYSGLVLLILLADTGRRAFAAGWWFGLGYFVTGLYWFAYALLVEADKFAWMIPLAVLGLPSILAVYYGIASWLFWRIPLRQPIARIILFSLIWLGIELLRGHLFTGFPWNLAAYSWGFSTVMIQLASLIGSYGLTAWTILLATLPAILFWPQPCQKVEVNTALALTLVMLLLPFSYGIWRLEANPTEYMDTTVRIVQGNIPQAHKWNPSKQRAALDKHLQLSLPAIDEAFPDLILWPEAAYPYIVEAGSPPLQYIAGALPYKSLLITGGMRAAPRGNGQFDVWNSLSVINSYAQVLATYDKHHLVPFGEFVPLRGFIPMEKKITHGIQDFARGTGVSVVESPLFPSFLPLICYEAIFPSLAEHLSKQPQWILNITNDAWFGESSGPYQHLQMSRMRAVEQGVPLVRVANTGISAMFDAYGRELKSLPLSVAGFLQGKLPKPIKVNDVKGYGVDTSLTIYFLLMVVLLAIFVNVFKNS